MLVTNPRKINHEELRVVAAEAKGSIKHLFCTGPAANMVRSLTITTSTLMSMAKFTSPAERCMIVKSTPGIATPVPLVSPSAVPMTLFLIIKASRIIRGYVPQLRCRLNRWRLLLLFCAGSWSLKFRMTQ